MKLTKNLIATALIVVSSMMFCGCQSNTVDFKYKAKAGTVKEYKLTETNKLLSQKTNSKEDSQLEQSINVIISEETKSITDKGERNIEISMSDATMSRTVDGKTQEMPIPQMSEQKIKFKMTDKGVITEKDGTEVTEDSNDSDSIISIRFDDKPTTKGGSWETKINKTLPSSPFTTDKISIVKKYTFEGYEKYKNKSLAKITEKTVTTVDKEFKNPQAKDKDKASEIPKMTSASKGDTTGTILFDVNQGCVVKAERTSKITTTITIDQSKMKDLSEEQKKNPITKQEMTNESTMKYELIDNDSANSNDDKAKEEKKPEDKKEDKR